MRTRAVAGTALLLIALVWGLYGPLHLLGVHLLAGVPAGMAGACYTAGTSGRLDFDPLWGTRIDGGTGGSGPVAWPPGFTARATGSEVEVVDPDGVVVATTGQRYDLVGAYVDGDDFVPQLPTGAFWACDRDIPRPQSDRPGQSPRH